MQELAREIKKTLNVKAIYRASESHEIVKTKLSLGLLTI